VITHSIDLTLKQIEAIQILILKAKPCAELSIIYNLLSEATKPCIISY
jgi:hypothetical protein